MPAGWSRRTRPSTGPTGMPPEHARHRRPIAAQGEALGKSRGGWTTKIHLVADRRCRPIARLISPGQHSDSPRFIPLMEQIRVLRRGAGRPRRTPGVAAADKAYSSAANRAYLRRRGIRAVIPVKEDQKRHRRNRGSAGGRPPAFDADIYKQRNTVERCFSKLEEFRAVATRYDKRERIYLGTIDVASIRIWLRDPVTWSTGHALEEDDSEALRLGLSNLPTGPLRIRLYTWSLSPVHAEHLLRLWPAPAAQMWTYQLDRGVLTALRCPRARRSPDPVAALDGPTAARHATDNR